MQGLMKRMMERSAEGSYRWALTLFPTHAYASEAGMSLADYEDFYFGACLATDDDPVGAWARDLGGDQATGRLDPGPGAGPRQRDRAPT